ncbi:MoxR family ATPase [Mesorhizobium sp. M1423]|uniref:AAA family ATPase n=1 Tax=Mesorhizobium sp. M1423 TaxID=2957101 RepID=UPI003336DEF1
MWFNTFSQATGNDKIYENGREIPDKGRNYIFTGDLPAAIDVAIGLGRPLLVSGDPGCGKTELGYAIARKLSIGRVHFFSTKSNSEARDLFYTYDAIGRFREAQAQSGPAAKPADAADYIEFQALGRAILDAHRPEEVSHLMRGRRAYSHPGAPQRSVVIIDEIDKASRDFPNDLLREIEDLAFRVPEMSRDNAGQTKPATARGAGKSAEPETPGRVPPALRPIIVVTSNEERQLPDAFLRRCVFHEIAFPSDDELRLIMASGLGKRFPISGGGEFDLPVAERNILVSLLSEFRAIPPDKRPGVSEMIDAATLLAYPLAEPPPRLADRLRATVGALAKLKNDRTVLADLVEQTVAQPR